MERSQKPLKRSLKRSCERSLLEGPTEKQNKEPTKREGEILSLISSEFLTPNQIAIRLNLSLRMVQKHLKSLRQKGLLSITNRDVRINDPTMRAKANIQKESIRLHGQQFTITILYKDERYKNKINQIITIDGNTIKCHRDIIEVYGTGSFFAEDPQKAFTKSLDYWNRFFIRLEQDLKVLLIKPRAQNIKLVSQHFARIGDELSEECNKRGDKFKVYANDDGKLWFTIDNSFSLNEAETLHPQTAKEDMENVIKYFNDMRDSKPPTLSELTKLVFNLTEIVLKNMKQQEDHVNK